MKRKVHKKRIRISERKSRITVKRYQGLHTVCNFYSDKEASRDYFIKMIDKGINPIPGLQQALSAAPSILDSPRFNEVIDEKWGDIGEVSGEFP